MLFVAADVVRILVQASSPPLGLGAFGENGAMLGPCSNGESPLMTHDVRT